MYVRDRSWRELSKWASVLNIAPRKMTGSGQPQEGSLVALVGIHSVASDRNPAQKWLKQRQGYDGSLIYVGTA